MGDKAAKFVVAVAGDFAQGVGHGDEAAEGVVKTKKIVQNCRYKSLQVATSAYKQLQTQDRRETIKKLFTGRFLSAPMALFPLISGHFP